MGKTDWEHYEVDLTSKPPAATKAAAPKKPVEKPLAGRGTRLGAKFIDLIVVNTPLALVFFFTGPSTEASEVTAIRVRYWIMGIIGVNILQAILLSIRGQSLGKLAAGIRIVDCVEESNPGFVRSVLWRSWLTGLIGLFPCLGNLFSLVDIGFIFSPDRRCIHDLFADTKVVQS